MKQQAKQTEIINAAQELFQTFGFEKTTMTDIAKHLGISKASLYYYFTDKEGIIRMLAIQDQKQFIAEIQTIEEQASSTHEKLVIYAGKRIELLQKHLTLSSINLATSSSIRSVFSSIIIEFRKKEIELVADILKNGIEKQEISEIVPEENAELYIDVLRGLRKNAFYNSEKFEFRKIGSTALNLAQKQSKLFTEIFIKGISK